LQGYALRLMEGLREKSLEDLNECKECAKDTVSSYYKLMRKCIKFPGEH
jgi:hypothetical protein